MSRVPISVCFCKCVDVGGSSRAAPSQCDKLSGCWEVIRPAKIIQLSIVFF